MADPFMAEIRIFSFAFAPKGWAKCDGQLLPINQNQALYSLLGVTYGGDGLRTFALPNFQSKVPIQAGDNFTLGQSGGEQTHTLAISEMPAHQHSVNISSDPGLAGATFHLPHPQGNYFGATVDNSELYFKGTADGGMNRATISVTGGSQPHENRQPFLALNFCISIFGIFPSRS